jgi:hypothetical protein
MLDQTEELLLLLAIAAAAAAARWATSFSTRIRASPNAGQAKGRITCGSARGKAISVAVGIRPNLLRLYDSTIRFKTCPHLIEPIRPIDRRLGSKSRYVHSVHFTSPLSWLDFNGHSTATTWSPGMETPQSHRRVQRTSR